MRDSWRSATLGEILEPLEHRAGRESNFEVLSVTEKRGIIPQTEVFNHRVATNDISKYKVLEPGDIAFNPYLLWCGAVGQWKGERPGVVSPVYEAFRARATAVARYIGLVFESGTLTPYFDSTAIGSIVRRRRTTLPVFNEAPINLPPIIEQKRIVDVMAAVDTYIAALQQQADDARAARNAVLHELLTTGGDDWSERNLGETLDISRGGSPRPIQEFITDREDGVNWVKIGDASNSSKYIYETKEKIKPAGVGKSRKVTSGDFLLSNSMSFGRPYIMRCDGCIHDGWLLLSNVATHFDEDFLYNLLMSDHVQKQFDSLAAGSSVRNLNIEAVMGVVVSLPPLSAQREIASIANTLDEFVWALEATVQNAKRMRQSVLAALLSGEHEIPDSYDRLLGVA
jgi:restriction endonuclease S subunit